MKKILLTVFTAVILTAVIISSSVLYKELSDDFQGSNIITDQNAISSQLGLQNPTDVEKAPASDNAQTPPDGNGSSPENPEQNNGDGSENSEGSENGNGNSPSEGETEPPAPETEKDEEKDEEKPKQPKNPAPDFTVLDENGNEVKLSDFRGKPVVLNFWATWCYYCKVEMPDFNKAFMKYPDVQFLMVNATYSSKETEAKARSFKSDNGYSFDIFFDKTGEAADSYNITGYPTTYLISAEGEVVASASGALNMSKLEYLVSLILPAKKED